MTLFSDALIRDKTSDQVDKMVPLEIVINCVNSVQDQRNVLSAEREGRGIRVYGHKYLITKKMCAIDSRRLRK